MDEDIERDVLTDSNVKWLELEHMFRRGEYDYNIISYEYSGFHYDKLGNESRFTSMSFRPEIIYNGFKRNSAYRDALEDLVSSFKTSFLYVVDDYTISISRRLDFFLQKRQDVKSIIKDCKYSLIEGRISHRKYKVIKENHDDQTLYDEYFGHKGDFDTILQSFTEIEYEVLLSLEEMLKDTLRFIPGRMEEIIEEKEVQKLNFNLKKSEIVLLLMALKFSGHIKGSTYASIAKFAERNFLYKYKPMKLIDSDISDFINGNVNAKASWKSLMEKLRNLKFED